MSHAPDNIHELASSARDSLRTANVQSQQPHAQQYHADEFQSGQNVSTAPERSAHMRTRAFTVTYSGSLDSFADPATKSTVWEPLSDQHTVKIFGISGLRDPSDTRRQANLSQVRFHEVRMIGYSNQHDVPMAIDIPGVHGAFLNDHGARNSAHLLPNTSCTTPMVIMHKAQSLTSNFAQRYPGYTMANIGTQGINRLQSGRACLVRTDHPVVEMIEMNSVNLKMAQKLCDTMEVDGCYQVATEVVDRVLGILTSEVVRHMPDVDCSRFKCELFRADVGLDATKPEGKFNCETNLPTVKSATKRANVSATFEVTFELPESLST